MNTKAIVDSNIERRIIVLLAAVLALQAFMYVYFVNSSIFNVVARKESEEMISVTETEITGLVAQYMLLSEKVTLDMAYEKGFVDAPAAGMFATIEPKAVALSLSNEI